MEGRDGTFTGGVNLASALGFCDQWTLICCQWTVIMQLRKTPAPGEFVPDTALESERKREKREREKREREKREREKREREKREREKREREKREREKRRIMKGEGER
ncbi:PREDICTED: Golgi resident protein GCP60-like, partial [Chaetura pelagica]|uniref:Golgi resident protein GCP60-like n=1 Tax=Chaetura pelagica TaxID=8897 RepID=UPI000523A7EB